MEVPKGEVWLLVGVLNGTPDSDDEILLANDEYMSASLIADCKTFIEVDSNAGIADAADKWMATFHPAGRPDSYTGGETAALIRAVQAKRDAMRPPTLEELIDAEIKQALVTAKTDDVAKRVLQLVKEYEKEA